MTAFETTRRRRPSHLAVVGEEHTPVMVGSYPLPVFAFWSGVGSPGRTTLAINIATELAISGKRVLLLDLDTLGPSIALNLGLVDTPAGLSAVLRLVEQGRLSHDEFRRLTVTIDLGRQELLLMTGLTSPERWEEVSPERLEAMLLSISPFVDLVVADLSEPTFSKSSLVHPSIGIQNRDVLFESILAKCSKLITVAGADPVSAKRFLEAQSYLTDVRGAQDQFVVVNRFRTGAIGANAKTELAESFESIARLRIDAFIPDDAENIDRAMRNGLPLALLKRSSPARLAIAELAKQLAIGGSKAARRG